MADEQSQPIPIEKGWPILGVLPNLLNGDPYEYLKKVMLERGDFVQLNFFNKPVYLISHPSYVKRVLWENYHNYRKPDMLYNVAREVAGNGLVTSDGEYWLRQRRMIQPHLHRKQLVHLFSDMVDAITDVLNDWEALAKNGTEVEIGKKMGEITGNVITRTMFGKEIIPVEESAEAGRRISNIIKYIGETLYSSMVPKWFPIPGRKQYLEDLDAVRATINKIITKSRQEQKTSASLIQMLIHTVDEETNQQMTEKQLFDEVMTIFVAGYETTATGLTWLIVALQKNPQVAQKLQAEIDDVLEGRTPTFEDISRLTYTRQVFMEVLRMYTIQAFLPRALNQADKLGPYELPTEAMVLVFFHGVHHNPRVWNQPEVFDPERFTTENITGRDAFAYLPFSAGPRKCAGNDFALLEGTLATAMIFQRYSINLLPNQTFDSRIGGTMQPRNGVKATFSKKPSA